MSTENVQMQFARSAIALFVAFGADRFPDVWRVQNGEAIIEMILEEAAKAGLIR